MPIWLRNFTFNKIREFYEQEAEANKKASSSSSNSTTLVDSSGKVNTPDFLQASKQYNPNQSTYITKSPKK